MSEVIVRKMQQEDLPEVLDLLTEMVPFAFGTENASTTLQKISQMENYAMLVAKKDGVVLGTVTAICNTLLTGNFIVVEDVVVREDTRGQGIGRKLMDAIDDFAKETKSDYTILVSSGFRKGAHQFYEACGYTEDVRGFRKMYI